MLSVKTYSNSPKRYTQSLHKSWKDNAFNRQFTFPISLWVIQRCKNCVHNFIHEAWCPHQHHYVLPQRPCSETWWLSNEPWLGGYSDDSTWSTILRSCKCIWCSPCMESRYRFALFCSIISNHVFSPSVYMFWQGKACDILGVHSHLGPLKSYGIFTWHSLTGCNTTGRFSRRGKRTWWDLYFSLVPEMNKDILHDFSEFRESADLLESTDNSLSRFTALGYAKRSDILLLARWKHFTKKMAEGEKLPPLQVLLNNIFYVQ